MNIRIFLSGPEVEIYGQVILKLIQSFVNKNLEFVLNEK